MPLQKIIGSVTNDLSGDQRVDRVCLTLEEMGFHVVLIGRKLPSSPSLPEHPRVMRRMNLLFRRGPLFYAEYNLRLFLILLFSRYDLLLSNDLDTLPANRLAAWIRRKPVIYDSHEYFTELPELVNRPGTRKIWAWFEKLLVPGIAAAYTASRPIAEAYTNKYGIPFAVVRNLPWFREPETDATAGRDKLAETPLPVIIYQGALNKGRGLEQAILAMDHLPEAELVIAGRGDLEEELQTLVAGLQLKNVRFTGWLSPGKLWSLTRLASLGISVEEDLGLNYRYALPNKLFDYIQARIPVVVSDLPEMGRIVTDHDIGLVAPSLNPETLAGTFRRALTDTALREKWSVNLEKAARQLNWNHEKEILKEIFSRYLVPPTPIP